MKNKKLLSLIIVFCMTISMFPGIIQASSNNTTAVVSTVAGLVCSDATVVANNGGTSIVNVDLLTQGKKVTITTGAIANDKIDAVKVSLAKGNLVDFKVADKANVAVVPSDAAKTFNAVLVKKPGAVANMKPGPEVQFDTMKYGPELSSNNGEAGNMVAAGWIYAKTADTITVGDGRIVTEDISGRKLPNAEKRYEETYKVDKNVVVYNVNTDDFSKSVLSNFASIPVTKDYNYATTSRQSAYFVFDKNYKSADTAKVVAIYYFTPMSKSDGLPVWDVPTQSFLLKDKGIDPVSGKTFESILANKPEKSPYTASTEPFEIVKNTMYWVGDNEVAIYLFNADMGTPNDKSDDRLIMLDAGWPYSGYQYWKNIESMGFDPRKITDIMLTHGHGDHYGTAVELITMIENSGGKVKLWGSKEDTFGITKDALGNSWDIKGALPASETVIRSKTLSYEYDKDYDFGNVKIMITPTPGHTPGTDSFVFKTKRPDNGEWVTFGYHGGYGFNGLYTPTATNGYLRLNFQLGLAWLQQMVDADYVAPQHTNQFPIVEVYQALKAYNNDPANAGKQLTLLDALTKNEFINFAEKRISVATNAKSDVSDPRYKSIETSGPFKPGRENGLTQVKATLLDGGKIIQGFNGFQNKNPQIPLLKNGVQIITDSYVNDPDGWYVQFYIDVEDSYKGYLPDNYTYEGVFTDPESKYGKPGFDGIFKVGGPVESLRPTAGAPEILRTQRLNSKVEAEAILATVKKGGSYFIDLTKASAIIVPSDVTKTFTPVAPVPVPQAELIPRTADSIPWNVNDLKLTPIDLKANGYVEEEYFLSGTANIYDWKNTSQAAIIQTPNAPYKANITIIRPADMTKFSGNVLVEVGNATAGYDQHNFWATSHKQIMRNGDVHVEVLSQAGSLNRLKQFDPVRYGSLIWADPADPTKNENGLFWDIYSQVASFIKSDSAVNPLKGHVKSVIGLGISQSSVMLNTYINAVLPISSQADGKPVYDGFLQATGPDYFAINSKAKAIEGMPERAIVPIIRIMSSADFTAMMGSKTLSSRAPDSDEPGNKFRLYEVAGMGHNTIWMNLYKVGQSQLDKIGAKLSPADSTFTAATHDFPNFAFLNGGIINIEKWVNLGIAPPKDVARIEYAPMHGEEKLEYVEDQYGNPEGGLRNPYVDVPFASYIPHAYSNKALSGPNSFTRNSKIMFTPEKMKELYGTNANYLAKFNAGIDKLVADGFVVKEDAEFLKAYQASLPNFELKLKVNRGEFIQELVKTLNLSATVDSNFSDVEKTDSYYNYVGIAKMLGIAEGIGNNLFSPKSNLTRQDMMTLVANSLKKAGRLNTVGAAADIISFDDASSVADYAIEGVASLVKAGLIEGGNNKLNPNGLLTRGEVEIVMSRIKNKYK
ncbi:MAG: hypothetical protein K0R31_328 [Clostridiales bacterium]|nr:hypothetical protein [Clostridiales bacterium]